MPPIPEIFQWVSWPGVIGTEACTYTCSHGITPGRAILVSCPQPDDSDRPAVYGDLVFSDGVHPACVLKGCKVDRLSSDTGPSGTTWTLEILDRRWVYKPPGDNGLGRISGRYNFKDTRGKLVPWSIRSPAELAELCFRAMGERNFRVRLPPGIQRQAGRNLDRYLKLGENFPQSLANPEAVWDVIPPGEALVRLCDLFGCRLVFQPWANRFVVVPLGDGRQLPDFPYENITPTLDSPETPRSVACAGAPVRIQARFRLGPVAREWDDSFVPIEDVSYRPGAGEGRPQISRVKFLAGTPVGLVVGVEFKKKNGNVKLKQCVDNEAGHDAATRLATVASCLQGDPDVSGAIEVVAGSTQITLTGKADGFGFAVTAVGFDSPATDNRWEVELVQTPDGGTDGGWKWADPPTFAVARPTDRLSRTEAQERARSSVFKCYRILDVDVSTGKKPLTLPWFGKVDRRQQVILQPTKVELVIPAPRIPGAVNRGVALDPKIPNQGVLPEFYNGYARDQGATVRGSMFKLIQNVNWMVRAGNPATEMNTRPTDRVFIEIASIDPVEQVVTFSDYVYKWVPASGASGFIGAPDLVLETACLVTDAETNEIVRWKEEMPLDGIALTEWSVREDVQVGVIGLYGQKSVEGQTQTQLGSMYLTGGGGAADVIPAPQVEGFNDLRGFRFADLDDSKARAQHYLFGMAKRYVLTAGETRKYVGIYGIEPDGYIQQVTVMVGEGATTIASSNSEHSSVIPPYPARRRAEALPPDSSARAANMAEREQVDKLIPRPGGAVK